LFEFHYRKKFSINNNVELYIFIKSIFKNNTVLQFTKIANQTQ
jgi:hypothetical protein